jgi:hypothetical protein
VIDTVGQGTFANDDQAKRKTAGDNLIVLAASYVNRVVSYLRVVFYLADVRAR